MYPKMIVVNPRATIPVVIAGIVTKAMMVLVKGAKIQAGDKMRSVSRLIRTDSKIIALACSAGLIFGGGETRFGEGLIGGATAVPHLGQNLEAVDSSCPHFTQYGVKIYLGLKLWSIHKYDPANLTSS